ncbi:MAG: tRNA uridine-5-carboxymethylaminomethyl(34) synthesis GTPase MnmE [Bacillota bacterium]
MPDTIAAIATAPGIGGIGIVRVSGPEAIPLAVRVFRGRRSPREAPSHSLSLGWVVDPGTGKRIDQVLLAVMRGPRTYTGEDVVEFQCHGGSAVLGAVLQALASGGARVAQPGEFTRRAFLNGRIDLAQAEAVLDIVNARTPQGLDVAIRQVEGGLSRKVQRVRDIILDALALVTAGTDFCDDVEGPDLQDVKACCVLARGEIEGMLSTFATGRVMRDGVRVAILGKPNTGKSSLLNALLRKDRAIVTAKAGTTRDVIEDAANIKGIPVVFLDTAGLRETTDEIEGLGVQRSRDAMASADVALVVLDDSTGIKSEDRQVLELTRDMNRVIVVNKADLGSKRVDIDSLRSETGRPVIQVSALLGTNIAGLETAIKQAAVPRGCSSEVLVSNVRHGRALEKAGECLERVLGALDCGMPLDIASLDLEAAARVLGKITGESVTQEVLERIFSQFCVGK